MKKTLQKPESTWVQCAQTVLYIPLLMRPVESAVDFGCNRGPWLRALIEHGIADVIGVDVCDPGDSLLFPREFFLKHDLSIPLELGRRFDLAIGLEVAEHIPGGEDGANNYVDTLVRHSDYVLFSAAVPGQGGHLHVNEQSHDYWHQKFLRRGYAKLDVIRPTIRQDWRVEWWYQRNTFMYVKPRYKTNFPVYA